MCQLLPILLRFSLSVSFSDRGFLEEKTTLHHNEISSGGRILFSYFSLLIFADYSGLIKS